MILVSAQVLLVLTLGLRTLDFGLGLDNKKSTIPYLQGLLNKECLKRRAELNDILTFKHVVKRRKNQIKDKNSPPMQVNYIGYTNPIT